jgi:hypothetical protein
MSTADEIGRAVETLRSGGTDWVSCFIASLYPLLPSTRTFRAYHRSAAMFGLPSAFPTRPERHRLCARAMLGARVFEFTSCSMRITIVPMRPYRFARSFRKNEGRCEAAIAMFGRGGIDTTFRKKGLCKFGAQNLFSRRPLRAGGFCGRGCSGQASRCGPAGRRLERLLGEHSDGTYRTISPSAG